MLVPQKKPTSTHILKSKGITGANLKEIYKIYIHVHSRLSVPMASTLSGKPLCILGTKLQNCSPPRILWDCPPWKKLVPSNRQEQ